MQPWTFYPAFIGTALSVVFWTRLAVRHHVRHTPRTLSELAAEEPGGLRYYQAVLWGTDPCFAATMLFFIVPRISDAFIVGTGFVLTLTGVVLISIYPAQRGKITAHDIFAWLMAAGMLISAYGSIWSLHGLYMAIELGLSVFMTVLALLTFADHKRYIFYELPFIFLAHLTVLVAAIALRQ